MITVLLLPIGNAFDSNSFSFSSKLNQATEIPKQVIVQPFIMQGYCEQLLLFN
jgi:hypothetical protein